MLSRAEYQSLDAVGLAALVNKGEVSPDELLSCALREIDQLNPELNAVVMRNDSQARVDAHSVDRSLPLAGVPFLAKDINVQIKHYRTTHACRLFLDAPIAKEDSTLVTRWRAAGLVVCGRTNTPEFATDFGCEPELYGATNNPWNLSLTPGGSSGGAAAAVAAALVPMAHASDSGGSIRAPASCCGVFGFKPGSGVVATGSPLGALVGGLNCDHAVTRSVRDSAAILDATAGPEVASSTVYAGTGNRYLSQLDAPLPRLRVGVTDAAPAGLTPTADMTSRVNDTAALLEGMGHEIVSWQWPPDSDPCDVASVFWIAELAAVVEEFVHTRGRQIERGDVGPAVEWSLQQSQSLSATDMVRARMQLRKLRLAMESATRDIDVLLTPCVAEAPLPSGLLSELVNQDVSAWMERAWQFAPYLEIFNVTGQPAMSVPLYEDDEGLPVGMHLAAAVGQDALLLRLARQLELQVGWRGRRPSVCV